MYERLIHGIAPIDRLPTRSGAHVACRTCDLDRSTIDWWQAEVQPAIAELDRLDAHWNWRFAHKTLTRLPGGFAYRGLSVQVFSEMRQAWLPCAMLLFQPTDVAFDDPRFRGMYLEYLAAAPAFAMCRLFGAGAAPYGLGLAGIDAVVCCSLAAGFQGRLALHASPEGGDRLLAFYRNRCGMAAFPREAALPGLLRRQRRNDGRYFYFDPLRAITFSASLDALRQVS